MAVQVELFDDLDAVARDAGGALAREARPEMFERLDWFRLVQEHTPPRGKPLVVRARNGAASAWLFAAVKGMAIWISSAKAYREGGGVDPVLGFSGWYTARRHDVILADLLAEGGL